MRRTIGLPGRQQDTSTKSTTASRCSPSPSPALYAGPVQGRASAIVRAILLCASIGLAAPSAHVAAEAPYLSAMAFPRLMGMNIGAKNYDDPAYEKQLAKLDVVMLGFYRGWRPDGFASSSTEAIRKAVQQIKSQHPGMLVGQYTVLNESYDDPGD